MFRKRLSLLVYRALRGLVAPVARLVYRPHLEGIGRIPREGPVIIASNHFSAADTAIIALVSPRPVAFTGKTEYFFYNGPLGRLTLAFFMALGSVPIDRNNYHAGIAALDAARKVLDDGGVLSIYPEGTRSLDGKLNRGHTGVAHLALTTGAPVVPMALAGTERLLPKNTLVPHRVPISVRIGEPMDFSDRLRGGKPAVVRRAVTDEIMHAIRDLSDQVYVDSYREIPE